MLHFTSNQLSSLNWMYLFSKSIDKRIFLKMYQKNILINTYFNLQNMYEDNFNG